MDLFPGLASYAVLVLCCLSVNQLRVPRGLMLPRHGINGCGGSSQWWPLSFSAQNGKVLFGAGEWENGAASTREDSCGPHPHSPLLPILPASTR
jgi:hypothetical protein